MKNKISFLTLAAIIVFTSSSCFISFRGGRASRPHHRDRGYVEPLKKGTEHASVAPLKLQYPSQVLSCNLDGYRAD